MACVTPIWSQTISNLCKEKHQNCENLLQWKLLLIALLCVFLRVSLPFGKGTIEAAKVVLVKPIYLQDISIPSFLEKMCQNCATEFSFSKVSAIPSMLFHSERPSFAFLFSLHILRIFKAEIPSPFSLYRIPGNPHNMTAHKITWFLQYLSDLLRTSSHAFSLRSRFHLFLNF